MKVKIDIDGLSDAVQEELKNWQEDTCNPVLNEAYKAGAEEGKKVLLQGGPYKERTGKYTKDWDVTQKDSRAWKDNRDRKLFSTQQKTLSINTPFTKRTRKQKRRACPKPIRT